MTQVVHDVWLCAIIVVSVFAMKTKCTSRWPTVLQLLSEDPDLSQFSKLVQSNTIAKLNVRYGEITVFAPNNTAFMKYRGVSTGDTVFYHMVWYAKVLSQLETTFLNTVLEDNPPLWITKQEDDIYINNARIVPAKSDFVSKTRSDQIRKLQVLHVIDEVLEPVFKRSSKVVNITAFDFLTSQEMWDIKPHKVDLYREKILQYRKKDIFRSDGAFTFFVPVDEGFTDHRFQMLDSYVIESHIIPRHVFFTRPAPKNFPFETLADGDYIYVLVSFEEVGGNMFVKSNTLLGDSNHLKGEIVAEIVQGNIPVRNGVIHLIKRPLVIFDKRLTMFPYHSIYDKVSMDPSLSIAYSLGEKNCFHEQLRNESLKFTYFIPRDKAWKFFGNASVSNYTIKYISSHYKDILQRHLVVSDVSYSMEMLRSLSLAADTNKVELPSVVGKLYILVEEVKNSYIIKWKGKRISVYRPNYQCSNGIVHIIDAPFIQEDLKYVPTDDKDVSWWTYIKNIFT